MKFPDNLKFFLSTIFRRRIQEELASCIAEGRRVHNDLEIAKRQIEDLKMQLQHYVAEVKRTEDLISQKVTKQPATVVTFYVSFLGS